jgi:hypothetical protein
LDAEDPGGDQLVGQALGKNRSIRLVEHGHLLECRSFDACRFLSAPTLPTSVGAARDINAMMTQLWAFDLPL